MIFGVELAEWRPVLASVAVHGAFDLKDARELQVCRVVVRIRIRSPGMCVSGKFALR
jgi:hypothetical protein